MLKLRVRGALATFATDGSCPVLSLTLHCSLGFDTPFSHGVLRKIPWDQTPLADIRVELPCTLLSRHPNADGRLFRQQGILPEHSWTGWRVCDHYCRRWGCRELERTPRDCGPDS